MTRILRDGYVWNANRPQSAIRAWGRVGVKTTSQKNDVIIHLRPRLRTGHASQQHFGSRARPSENSVSVIHESPFPS